MNVVLLLKGCQAHHIRLKLDTKATFRENEVSVVVVVTVGLEGKLSCPFARRD
jgi:hypothetical protein